MPEERSHQPSGQNQPPPPGLTFGQSPPGLPFGQSPPGFNFGHLQHQLARSGGLHHMQQGGPVSPLKTGFPGSMFPSGPMHHHGNLPGFSHNSPPHPENDQSKDRKKNDGGGGIDLNALAALAGVGPMKAAPAQAINLEDLEKSMLEESSPSTRDIYILYFIMVRGNMEKKRKGENGRKNWVKRSVFYSVNLHEVSTNRRDFRVKRLRRQVWGYMFSVVNIYPWADANHNSNNPQCHNNNNLLLSISCCNSNCFTSISSNCCCSTNNNNNSSSGNNSSGNNNSSSSSS